MPYTIFYREIQNPGECPKQLGVSWYWICVIRLNRTQGLFIPLSIFKPRESSHASGWNTFPLSANISPQLTTTFMVYSLHSFPCRQDVLILWFLFNNLSIINLAFGRRTGITFSAWTKIFSFKLSTTSQHAHNIIIYFLHQERIIKITKTI